MTIRGASRPPTTSPSARAVLLRAVQVHDRHDRLAELYGGAGRAPDRHVIVIHRVGALVVAAVIAVFGTVGLLGGLAFLDTHGRPVLGLSSNGLLSVVSLCTAAVLVAAAVRGGWWASTVMMVVGTLFLISALANLAVLDTRFNLLAFRLPNVFFSIGAGLVLLLLGAYGRVSGHLPDDNPYRVRSRSGPNGPALAPAHGRGDRRGPRPRRGVPAARRRGCRPRPASHPGRARHGASPGGTAAAVDGAPGRRRVVGRRAATDVRTADVRSADVRSADVRTDRGPGVAATLSALLPAFPRAG